MTALTTNIQTLATANTAAADVRLAGVKAVAQVESASVAYWYFGYGYFSQEPSCL